VWCVLRVFVSPLSLSPERERARKGMSAPRPHQRTHPASKDLPPAPKTKQKGTPSVRHHFMIVGLTLVTVPVCSPFPPPRGREGAKGIGRGPEWPIRIRDEYPPSLLASKAGAVPTNTNGTGFFFFVFWVPSGQAPTALAPKRPRLPGFLRYGGKA